MLLEVGLRTLAHVRSRDGERLMKAKAVARPCTRAPAPASGPFSKASPAAGCSLMPMESGERASARAWAG